VDRSQNTGDELKRQTRESAIRYANMLSEIIAADPDILNEDIKDSDAGKAGLGLVMNRLKLSEMSVVDERGIVIAAYPSVNIGVDFNQPPLDEFLKLRESPEPIVQEIRPNFNNPDDMSRMYVGVRRLDQPGVVQLGLEANRVEKIYQLGSLANFIEPSVETDRLFADFNRSKSFEVGDDVLAKLNLDQIKLNELQHARLDGKTYLVFARQHDDLIYVVSSNLRSLMKSRFMMIASLIVANFFIFFLVFFLISYLIKRCVVENVYKINGSLEKITNGDLNERVDVTTSKEFADLSNGVNMTVDALKNANEEVTKRVEEELAVAQKIQAEALPDLAERFSEEDRFEVFGINRPMHRIGGDMYDFFFINDRRAMFYVADVSGHGVPAALVMMKTMALVKNLALSKKDIATVVTLTNEYLSENNSSMFVTGFFCVIDLKTGVTTYVNAGHNPPFLRRKGGKFEEIKPTVNLLLGIGNHAPYESAELKLEPGDELALYTDGITAATASDIDLFETSRALEALNGVDENASAKTAAKKLFEAIDRFTDSAEPSDDQTLLLFKLNRLDQGATL
ncbi:MAG: SpoIIE family protein phosphatase, partial [Thermoguttaceae bacterium]|nr:SpoIIE family protein phosphatase [Thermoguttaceae bacterium]